MVIAREEKTAECSQQKENIQHQAEKLCSLSSSSNLQSPKI